MARVEIIAPMQRRETPPKRVLPLSFVPEAKNRLPSPGLISVAGHELNHALIAWAYGVPIESISVIPSGNILGRTTLAGFVSEEVLKVIAAGRGAHTHNESAEGYGSDKFKVDLLHHFHGGHSWDSARSHAENIVAGFSTDVRRKAAEIIAYLGRVSGSMMGDIMLRAQMEINEEKGQGEPITEFVMPEIKSENRTIIEDFPNNIQKITYVIVGKKDEEKLLCGVCHEINAHTEKCPNTKIKDNQKVDSKEDIFSMPKLFPRGGTIFIS